MTLYDLYHRIQDIGIQVPSIQIPILKDGKDIKLDFKIISENGFAKHIEMIVK